MSVLLNADTDYLLRSGIPAGTDGTLSLGGISNFTVCGWYLRNLGVGAALMSEGAVVYTPSAARDLFLYFDNTFINGDERDGRLQLDGDSGAINKQFADAEQPPFEQWVFFGLTDIGGRCGAWWSPIYSESFYWVQATNSHVSSQYAASIYIGSNAGANVAAGSYSHWRAIKHGVDQAQAQILKRMSIPSSSDWGFWPLTDADPEDYSGHQRTLTIGGTVESDAAEYDLLRYFRGAKTFYIRNKAGLFGSAAAAGPEGPPSVFRTIVRSIGA